MGKTTVQQLMSELEELHPELFNIYTPKGREFVNHFHKYLEIEKLMVIASFEDGVNDEVTGTTSGEYYYNKKYGGNNG